MNHRLSKVIRTRMTVPFGLAAVLVAGLLVVVPGINRNNASADAPDNEGRSGAGAGLGQRNGLLPRDHLTMERDRKSVV